MKTIKVYGELKKKLGQATFQLDVTTPAQAIKALCVNFPDLTNWFIDNDQNGYGYKVEIGKQRVFPDNIKPMLEPFADAEVLQIVPVITGAGRGLGQLFAGIALLGLSAILPGVGLLGLVGEFAGIVGISLTIRGINEILFPSPPSIPEASKLKSFSFSGIVNVTEQGLPVPICYGRVYTGSIVVSFGLDSQPAT